MARGPESSQPHDDAVAPAAGLTPFGKSPMRTFVLVVALPAIALYALSVVLVVTALSGMANEINRVEQQRGVTSMHAALDTFLNGMSRAVSDEGTWDEAFLNVVVTPDPAWMDTTWGATARLGESYDTVLVTDQSGEIVFGENVAGLPVQGVGAGGVGEDERGGARIAYEWMDDHQQPEDRGARRRGDQHCAGRGRDCTAKGHAALSRCQGKRRVKALAVCEHRAASSAEINHDRG